MIFGRTRTFAIGVRPLAGPPPEGDPAAAATWAALQMFVGRRNVLRNVRGPDRVVYEEVHWPAIGLARWFVRSWPTLFHGGAWARPGHLRNSRDLAAAWDQQLARDLSASEAELDARDAFVSACSLRAAASGAALPDLWFARDGELVSVAWHDSTDGDPYFPLPSKGEADVPARDFAEAVFGFVQWVKDTLARTSNPGVAQDIALLGGWLERFSTPAAALEGVLAETRLGGERWRRVARLAQVCDTSPEELLGLGAQALALGTLAGAESSAIALAFRCAAPVLDDEELVSLRQAIVGAPRNERGFSQLNTLAAQVAQPTPTLQDYVRGYRLARALRRVLGQPTEPLDVEALFAELHLPVLELPLSDPELDGGCVCDPQHGPLVFVNPRSGRAAVPWGRRVVLAHELCHLLFDRDHAAPFGGAGLGVVSGPWAPPRIERAANAFAIELLLPLAGVLERVGRAWEAQTEAQREAQVSVLMDAYGLGRTAVTEHLANLARARNR